MGRTDPRAVLRTVEEVEEGVLDTGAVSLTPVTMTRGKQLAISRDRFQRQVAPDREHELEMARLRCELLYEGREVTLARLEAAAQRAESAEQAADA